ncbi:putative HTH-type transcriptional regulator YulB [Paenibacillus montaniterrae]|uniref:HTH-type transcriptional regulator YulB n=1 Tax=Paenibacillus montaniterrae TaxID=429341 RepID=A0A919YR81_9BACL|nr:DeoR/GlpR family DNA-binding transcription regulator [Paenibacillus montaniterrae]GIP18195.1 putative HTH-type transcriptional regulator YulB [Paenibacillus montaniterrae]
MLVAERYEKIVQLVNERGSIRVSELSELCSVTEETIRRDLDKLEQAGRLKRSHGGAVSVKESQLEIPYFEREVTRSQEKKRIAEEAVKLIQPHDRILLDASTSAWYMAKIMPDIPITILTNAVKVATELSAKEKIEVISLGGRLSPRSLSFVGPIAEKTLESFHVNKLFFSCKGVHLERGISESGELQARLKQQMIEAADQIILLADSSKFGVKSFTQVADLSMVDTIISDRELDEEMQTALAAAGIAVTLA